MEALGASFGGATPPAFWPNGSKFNTDRYVDPSENGRAPLSVARYGGGGPHFRGDVVTSHVSRETMEVPRKMSGPGQLLRNPPNFPDLSPPDYSARDAVGQKAQPLGREVRRSWKNVWPRRWGELDKDDLKKANGAAWVKRLAECARN